MYTIFGLHTIIMSKVLMNSKSKERKGMTVKRPYPLLQPAHFPFPPIPVVVFRALNIFAGKVKSYPGTREACEQKCNFFPVARFRERAGMSK